MRLALLLLAVVSLIGCGSEDDPDVVLYTSVDESYSRPIVEAFEADTGLSVRLVTDTEATKSVGLAERLRAERSRPTADVWWGNEPFHTVRLADEGLFARHDWPTAAALLPMYRDGEELFAAHDQPTVAGVLPMYCDAEGRWVGNGLRARVIASHPGDGTRIAVPHTIEAIAAFLGDPAAGGHGFEAVMARPTAGTTAGHVAAIYAVLGQEEADALFRRLHAGGVRLVAGNGPAARFVTDRAKVALTDNDDVANLNRNGDVTLDATPAALNDEIGTLTIPTTVALVAKPVVSDAAKKLADFLASPEVEAMLAEAEFTLASTREPNAIRAMDVDYAAVAALLPEATRRATAILEGREP